MRLYLILISLCIANAVFAQNTDDGDASDQDTRLNPVLGVEDNNVSKQSRRYSYIRYNRNHITMNGDNWTELRNKLAQTKDNSTFTIVHIGDSHIQADGNTGTTRRLMQQQFGNAGRGLIIPFKIAGTNQPLDYTFSSPNTFIRAKLMNLPWPTTMGFSGVSIRPVDFHFSLNIKNSTPCGYFTLYASGQPKIDKVTAHGRDIPFETEAAQGGVTVYLDEDVTEFNVTISGGDINIFGIDLRNDQPGVVYHAIGNNGAAYSSYNTVPGFAEGIASLEPDLIIISLGTNEAFGRLDKASFQAQINSMVNRIRHASPDAKILLTTPSECQRSVYTRSKVKKGRKSRTRRTRTYQVNTNVARAREYILDYGATHGIPVYDFYDVAGGAGASAHWLNDKLLNTDRIHRTWAGYRLDGELMYDALNNALSEKR